MKNPPDQVFTVAERAAMLVRMKAASNTFYRDAIAIHCHPWIEFTGLMNEYIKMAEAAHKEGVDFTQLNTHTGAGLPIKPFHLDYLQQKVDCIFSDQLEIRLRSPFAAVMTSKKAT